MKRLMLAAAVLLGAGLMTTSASATPVHALKSPSISTEGVVEQVRHRCRLRCHRHRGRLHCKRVCRRHHHHHHHRRGRHRR